MKKYSISKEAIRDLDEISDYLANQNIESGERFLKRFAEKCKKLIDFPKMGRVYLEFVPEIH